MDHMLKETYFMKDPFTSVNIKLVMIFTHLGSTRVTRYFVIFTMLALLSTSLVTKIAKIANSSNDLILLAELIPSIATLAGCIVTILSGNYLDEHIRLVFTHIVQDIRKKRDEAEVAIKKTYERNGLLVIRFITCGGLLMILVLLSTLFMPHILDVIWPINETRPPQLPFHGEHFVDEEKYFYYIAVSQYLTCTVVAMVVESAENSSVLAIAHLCGLMAAFGYKVENMVQTVEKTVGPNAVDYEKQMIHMITVCCNEYKALSELFVLINHIANIMIPFVLLLTFISFSMLLVTLVNVESINIYNAGYACAVVAQFALISLLGQTILNESSKLQYNVYNALWYNVPAKIQRLFLLIIMRMQKPFVITAATYELTVGSFAAVVKTAMSFCMVLREML